MKPIINEWQLDSQLNVALQSKQRADFSLFLALLSTAVEESAEFNTPDSPVGKEVKGTLQQQLNIRLQRPFAWQSDDDGLVDNYAKAVQQSGLKQVKLFGYLKPEPLVYQDDKAKLPIELWQSLDLHSKRRLAASQPLQKVNADPAALYEILERLHQTEAA